MKKIIAIILAALCLCSVMVACDKNDGQKEIEGLLGIIVAWRGGTLTTTDYEFTKSDFYVLASYSDGSDKEVSDYEFEVEGLKNGYYRINFKYGDTNAICDVPCNVDVYPSDRPTYTPPAGETSGGHIH